MPNHAGSSILGIHLRTITGQSSPNREEIDCLKYNALAYTLICDPIIAVEEVALI
jgi:hypothetical protein